MLLISYNKKKLAQLDHTIKNRGASNFGWIPFGLDFTKSCTTIIKYVLLHAPLFES